MSRAAKLMPAEPPALVRAFHMPARVWTPVEWIPTACERLIERRTIKGESIFTLWEPVIDGAQYSLTRPGKARPWGAAHTRRPRAPLAGREAIDWELGQQRRAMDVLAGILPELDGGQAEGVYRQRGTILLSGDPQARAERAQAARRP